MWVYTASNLNHFFDHRLLKYTRATQVVEIRRNISCLTVKHGFEKSTACSIVTKYSYDNRSNSNGIKRNASPIIRTHGLDFKGIKSVFNGYTLTVEDTRFDYGEQRFVTLGLLQDRVVVIVHTECEQAIRIISVRKATNYEQGQYFSQI